MLAPDNTDGPEFAIAMRGYDRPQVDDYLARLHEWLLESQSRTAQAEEEAAAAGRAAEELRKQLVVLEERSFNSTPDSIKALGDRVGRILTTAFEAAEDMKTSAERDAGTLRSEAEARATQIVEDARVEAEGLVEDARRREAVMEQRVRALGEHRSQAEEELGRLQQFLSEALQLSANVAAPDVQASEPGPPTQLVDLTALEAAVQEATQDDGSVASSS